MSRSLPKKQNPLIAPNFCPDHDELLSRRRLGKTKLQVKPGQVGTSNATKPENLGVFEYVHLRAPLPKDLKGSEMFDRNQKQPETYFLMRRSKDGYVSATGMFKTAYPWALQSEEKAEREYLKSKESTSQDEVAGNVWISPELALELAKEYGLYDWIKALLDPEEIVQSPGSAQKHISPPPKFEMPESRTSLPPPATKQFRSRSTRSASPSKIATPAKKTVATPRKRQTKAQREANEAHTNAANASLQSALDYAASTPAPESVGPESVNGETVRVDVDSTTIEVNGETETTHTNVTVEMPAGSPDLPLPEDTEQMLETAKKMVAEAKALDGGSSPKTGRKRKADEVEPSDIDTELPVQPAKKAKVLEEQLKREKVRTRAMVGVTAALAIAAAIPYFF